MNKKTKILFFCMIFACASAYSQSNRYVPTKNLLQIFPKAKQIYKSNIYFTQRFVNPEKNPESISVLPYSINVIDADFYTNNFGFFCKKELQIEKAIKIPIKFRLGSLQYNDYLEQKPNAINPN